VIAPNIENNRVMPINTKKIYFCVKRFKNIIESPAIINGVEKVYTLKLKLINE
jgi:hypothetical protein